MGTWIEANEWMNEWMRKKEKLDDANAKSRYDFYSFIHLFILVLFLYLNSC